MRSYFQLIITAVLLTGKLAATNYYLSATGSNTNSGTNSSFPWLSVSQLTTVTYVAGDTVFFKCGDTFTGSIQINQSGTNANNIVFTSYGSGAKPIISGALSVSNWTLSGPATYGTIYQAAFTQTPTMFYANNREKIIARFPNDHSYLTVNSCATNSMVDNSLLTVGSATINNSKICLHNRQWCWEKTGVASVSGASVNFTGPITISGLVNYGYFFYDNILHLDTLNEWKYDGVTQKINYVVPVGQTPTVMTCEASVSSFSNGIEFGASVKYIQVKGLSFEKQSNAGIFINGTGNQYIKIDNCSFAHQYMYGVQDKGRYNEISNCYFREVDGLGIYLSFPGRKSTVHHNTLRNIGEFRNSGFGMQYNLTAIHNSTSDSCYIHHNDVDSTGYCGISVDAAYNTIEKNIVRNAMLCNNDGAALKSFGPVSHHNLLQNNIIYNSNGNTEGTSNPDFLTPGIYFDFYVNNTIIRNNTITQHTKRGIFQNSGNTNNSIIENVVYGADYGVDLNGTSATTIAMTGMTVKKNSLFVLSNTGYCIKEIDMVNNNTFNLGYIDSNYLFNPYNTANIAMRMYSATPVSYSFQAWQATGNDLQGKKSFVNWTLPTNNSTIIINPSDNISTFTVNGLYLDLDSNNVCNSITLQPYTSKILINAMQTCVNSINEQTMKTTISVHPNPASDIIFVTLKEQGLRIINVTLTDVQGKIVRSQPVNTDQEKIYTGNLPEGLYLVRVTDNAGKISTKKIIINH